MKRKKSTYDPAKIEILDLLNSDIITNSQQTDDSWELGGEDDNNSDPNGWT